MLPVEFKDVTFSDIRIVRDATPFQVINLALEARCHSEGIFPQVNAQLNFNLAKH